VFCYRSEFVAKTEAEECERAPRHLESVLAMEGPDTIAAIVLETIPGPPGLVPPDGYLAGVRALSRRPSPASTRSRAADTTWVESVMACPPS